MQKNFSARFVGKYQKIENFFSRNLYTVVEYKYQQQENLGKDAMQIDLRQSH
ncbi:hypothetical protein B4110_2995 [Parageobacillus toebii]|uniref:Uncharacterized protein n=1 Tax=Parageobacillus toebii TaxID=153151 RepID=A0A150N5T6_9BACL|nr:hypothetical protein B4110_2995 [Parageobacillus toebii]